MAALPPIYPNQAPRTNSINGIPVREDVLFTNAKGKEKPALRKSAEAAIEKLKVALPKLLEPGEALLCIVPGIAPLSPWEHFFLGWYTLYMKGVTLVLTDRRLLRFRRKSKGFRDWEWNRGVMAARWADMADVKVKGWLIRYLDIKYRDGKKERYQITGMGPGKKVKSVVVALFPDGAVSAGAPSGANMVSQCPECVRPLTPGVYQCSGCGSEFKNEKALLWRNYLIPGGGYFYTGFTTLGVLQAIVDVSLFVEIVTWTLVVLHFTAPPAPEPGKAPIPADQAAIYLLFVVGGFLFENSVSWLHTRKMVREFIPER